MQFKKFSLDILMGVIGTILLLASWNCTNKAGSYEEQINRNLLNLDMHTYEVTNTYLNVIRNIVSKKWVYQLASYDSTLMINSDESEIDFLSDINYSYLRQRAEASAPLIGSFTSDPALEDSFFRMFDSLLYRIENRINTDLLLNDVHHFEGTVLKEYSERLNTFHTAKNKAERWSRLLHITGTVLLILALLTKKREKLMQVKEIK